MDKTTKIRLTVLSVMAVAVTAEMYVISRQGRKERAKIYADAAAQIEAMNCAADTVRARIAAGYYNRRPLTDLHADLEFYTIAHLEEH
jgi:hypothetical protein